MKITLRLSTQKQETTDMGFNLDDYEPVASRIQRFYEAYPNGAIHCEIVHDDGKRVMVKATVWRDINDPQASAVDYAEEHLSDRGVNATSRTENACTSATGRAISIAAHGLGPSDWTKKPSREEMGKVQRMTQSTNEGSDVVTERPANAPSDKQLWLVKKLHKDAGKLPPHNLGSMDKFEVSRLIESLKSGDEVPPPSDADFPEEPF
jgi:hypothetical protein